MLSLRRRVGQVVYVGPHIKISIASISGNQVRLGIQAPDDFVILREELLETIEYPVESDDESPGVDDAVVD